MSRLKCRHCGSERKAVEVSDRGGKRTIRLLYPHPDCGQVIVPAALETDPDGVAVWLQEWLSQWVKDSSE